MKLHLASKAALLGVLVSCIMVGAQADTTSPASVAGGPPATQLAAQTATTSAPARSVKTLAEFEPKLSSSLTPATALAIFGEPDRRTGSGLIIFVYSLRDGRALWLGFPGYSPILYAKVKSPDGTMTDLKLPSVPQPGTQPTGLIPAEAPWGKAVDGVACRLIVPESLCVGQAFRAVVEIKNASDKPLQVLDVLDPLYPKIAKFDVTGPRGPLKISCSGDCGFQANQWKVLKPGDTLRWEITDLCGYFQYQWAKLGGAGKFSLTYTLMGAAPVAAAGDAVYWKGTCVSNTVTVQVNEPTAEDLTVHEWGVFTVCQDIQFANAGMKAEWASMPEAFYRQFPKRLDVPQIPSRMRKPIIYFYSGRSGLHVNVGVDFKDGAPVIWWPYASMGVISQKGADGKLAIQWVDPQSAPSVAHKLQWSLWLGDAFPINTQMVNAKTDSPWQAAKLFELPACSWVKDARIEGPALVSTAARVLLPNGYGQSHWETEKFIYYDGLAPAPTCLATVEMPGELPPAQGGPVAVKNNAKFALERVLLIDRRTVQKSLPGRWALIEKLAPGEQVQAVFQDSPGLDKPGSERQALSDLLLARGLTKNEVAGLLCIWQEEFFQQSGVTALYVLPQAQYDRMLPLEIDPTPGKIIRVGIVHQPHLEGLEVIRKEAADLVAKLGDNNYKKREEATKALRDMGVEIVPVLQKALSGATDPEVKMRLEKLLKTLDATEDLKTVTPPSPPRGSDDRAGQ